MSAEELTPKPDSKEFSLLMGSHHKMTIVKEFGPLIACNLRVYIDGDCWVVERWRDTTTDGEGDWEQMARFDCQESLMFSEEK